MENFSCWKQDGTSVAVTDVSSRTTLPAPSSTYPTVSLDVMIDNPGPNDVYIKTGGSSITATTLSLRVPGSSIQVFNKGQASSHMALICATGKTQTVTVFVGDGD
jgi:hypothetical protein